MSESVGKSQSNKIQDAVDELSNKSEANKSQPNEAKCKELRMVFSKTDKILDPDTVNDTNFEVVQVDIATYKILGLNLSSDLRWNTLISEKISKVSFEIVFLRQLRLPKVACKEFSIILRNLH